MMTTEGDVLAQDARIARSRHQAIITIDTREGKRAEVDGLSCVNVAASSRSWHLPQKLECAQGSTW
jgi:hypothetical protein